MSLDFNTYETTFFILTTLLQKTSRFPPCLPYENKSCWEELHVFLSVYPADNFWNFYKLPEQSPEKGSEGHLVQAPMLKQSHPEMIPQDYVQMAFEYL